MRWPINRGAWPQKTLRIMPRRSGRQGQEQASCSTKGYGICAIAMAYHVIDQACDWGQPIRVIKDDKPSPLNASDRAMLTA